VYCQVGEGQSAKAQAAERKGRCSARSGCNSARSEDFGFLLRLGLGQFPRDGQRAGLVMPGRGEVAERLEEFGRQHQQEDALG
jgi:hypothetical protein